MADTVWNEDDVIESLMCHDEQALHDIMRRYGALFRSLARQITGSAEDAEECVNDALLDLWNAVPPDRPVSLLAYTTAFVRRRAIDKVRRRAAEKREGLAYYTTLDELSDILIDPTADTINETLAIRDAIKDFLASISEDDRIIFLLRYYRFFDNKAISRHCGLRESAVVMRLVRLRKRLRRHLEDHGIHL